MAQETRNSQAKVLLLSSLVISSLSALPVKGQEQAATETEDDIERIFVTANKRLQDQQEVPVSVSVISADLIENAEIMDIIDLQASVPSLRVNQLQTSSSTTFAIRGFGNGSNNPGIDPSVGVFVDGVFRSRVSSSLFDFPTLERVEVLRGPQSTLFGKNVSVGAINITTQLPSDSWEGSAEATVGNLNTRRLRGTISGPLNDELAFRLSGTTNERDGTYRNLVTGDENINDRDRWSLRGQLLWEPTEDLTFRLIGDVDDINETCCGAVFFEQGPITSQLIEGVLGGLVPPADATPGERLVAVNRDPINELEGKGLSLQADWDLGWAAITSITAYRSQTDFNTVDGDFTGADIIYQSRMSDFDTFTQEIRLSSEWESDIGKFNWIAGGFYFSEDLTFDNSVPGGSDFRAFGNALLAPVGTTFGAVEGLTQIIGALTADSAVTGAALFPELSLVGGPSVLPTGSSYANGAGPGGRFKQDNELFSLFFQTDWEASERLTFTLGLGYTKDRKEVTADLNQLDPFQNIDLSQFATSGISLEAASLLGQAMGVPFDLTNPAPFFTTAAINSALDPTFEATRLNALQTAIANAAAVSNGTLPPSQFLAAGLGLTQLDALQIFRLAPGFPAEGAVRDDDITLSDDGYVVDDAFTYTMRVAFDWTENTNLYASYSTGYKSPASNLALTTTPPVAATDGSIVGRFAEGEDVRVVEVGLKGSYSWGFFNLAVFDQSVDNFQSVIFTGTGQQLSNAGEQTVRGVELEASYNPTSQLNLFLGLTYLDPEFDSFAAAPCPSSGFASITDPAVIAECASPDVNSVDLSGTRPPGIHDISLTTSIRYEFELGNGKTLTPRIEYLYEDETSLFEPHNGQAPAREVSQVNANLLLSTQDGWSVNLWGRNLTDDDSIIAFFNSVAQAGSFNSYVTPPRQWGLSVRKEFY